MLHSAEDLGLVAESETASSNLQDDEEDDSLFSQLKKLKSRKDWRSQATAKLS